MLKRFMLFLATFFVCTQINAQQIKKVVDSNQINRPRLVVGLVIDQMRWDYLYRYKHRFVRGGFNRLLKHGYSFENNFIPYTPAVTGSGHTAIYTGSVPALHGIVGNDWVERSDGALTYCTRDTTVKSVGGIGLQGQMSPKNLLATTIGDELRLATNFRSKVYGVSLKDRGGILAAGRSGNASYWFDDANGNMITSTWYMRTVPDWVNKFNASRKVDSMMATDWKLLYPKSSYTQSTADDVAHEKPLMFEKTVTFPHKYLNSDRKNYYDFRVSPYGNTYTLDFASALISAEKLGATGATDMLCISLSSTDYIGHRFGPNSLEIEDTYLRLDKDIENFLKSLDAKVGAGNYLLFLSSDHGAPPVPDYMKENKMSAGHLNAYFGIKDSLNKIGLEKFGVSNIVRAVLEYQVFLDHAKIKQFKIQVKDVLTAMADYLNAQSEVNIAFNYEDLPNTLLPAKVKEMLINGYFRKRSGDLHFILNPNFTDVGSTGTEHGTIYNYDTHIPMIWFGWQITGGRSYRNTYLTDIAPTLAAMLKIQMPNASVGNVMTEVIK